MNRQERRAFERAQKANAKLIVNGSGYGIGNDKSSPASGQAPQVNPFILPKSTGLNVISKTFPSNYYKEWTLSTWRAACDQAIKMGYPIDYATMVSWCYESSPFVQSLFTKIASAVEKAQIFLEDSKGNNIELWSEELCSKAWFKQLMKEIVWSKFWGFTLLNFDPINGKVYKYPMQDVDPINRFIRQSTYNIYDGVKVDENVNLLFVQPSTSYESFLGWMQPITRAWIQINMNNNNWVAAGRRLAYPLLTIGYPTANESIDADGNAFNPYKSQAEAILQNADPTYGIAYPYTKEPNGDITKSLEIGVEGATGTQNAHKVFAEFNTIQKDEIREMIFGGTLTSSTQGVGSQALGNVHEKQLENVHKANMEFLVSELNGEFLRKIQYFYKNFPKDAKFSSNKAKEWTLEEVVQIAPILNQNSLKLKPEFFESMGLTADFLEEAEPVVLPQQKQEPKAEIAKNTSFAFLKKKSN